MPATRKEKVGMKEIAEAAGVSVMTVSAVLSGVGRVSDARKREIISLAQRMGYRRNAAARLLKSKRVADLGLLIFEKEALIRENAVFMDMTVQFMRECTRNNIHFQLEWFDCYRNREELPQMLTSGLVGGLLIAGAPANAAKRFIEKDLALPYVALGENGRFSVTFDSDDRMRQAIYYLTSLGHENIGLVNGPSELSAFRHYREVFDATLKELSLLRPDTLYIENHPADDFQTEVNQHLACFLGVPNRPTALLVHSGLFTKALISGLFRAGVRVPEDVSVICYETVDWEVEKFVPSITAIEFRLEDLVVAGVRMVRELLDGKEVLHPNFTVSPAFTKRGTVCPPKSF